MAAAAALPGAAAAASLCVGGGGCSATLQAAVHAAADGDTIRVNAGTYAGGVTIDKNLTILGDGAAGTRISGGGPVLTIGRYRAAHEPTVTLDGLTITGGHTTDSPQSADWFGSDHVVALGGGIDIPPAADYALGATVTIRHSIITNNRVAPTRSVPVGPPCPGGKPCPYAGAGGGGIDSWGSLTLVDTLVTGNRIGTPSGLSQKASDADGGGILSWNGPVTLRGSQVRDNEAGASAPNGRSADGGGVIVQGGTFDMRDSAVSDNRVTLDAALPDSVGVGIVAGGIHLTDNVSTARIVDSSVSGNVLTMTNTVGSTSAFSGGLHVDQGVGTFELLNSDLVGNVIHSDTLAGSTGDANADSAGGEMHGTIIGGRISDNRIVSHSVAGNAGAAAGFSIFTGTITGTLLDGNSVSATSPHGDAYATGGAMIADGGGITLRGVTLRGNSATGIGHAAVYVQGGAIFDWPIPDGPAGGPLTLVDSSITGNVLTGSPNAVVQGGGVYASGVPVTVTNTVLAHNRPDQCDGC
jgi:hypothetical protein